METSVNNKCRAFTSLEQSKKLAEILPIESADMCYIQDLLAGCKYGDYKPYIGNLIPAYGQDKIKCWSLAALLDYLSANFHTDIRYLDNYWELDCRVQFAYGKELVDACYEMILKLHELKML